MGSSTKALCLLLMSILLNFSESARLPGKAPLLKRNSTGVLIKNGTTSIKKPVLLTDDEDFQNDAGSGPDYDVGSAENPGDAQYRGTVNFTSLQYKPALGRRESDEFKSLAQSIGQAIENVYTDFPGTQTVQVLQFRPGHADPRAAPSLLATFDLQTQDYYNRLQIFNALHGEVQRGYLGEYRTSPEGFAFKSLTESSTDPPPSNVLDCEAGEFRCDEGTCIPAESRCDVNYDCPDRSDETNCPPRVESCADDQFRCPSSECIPYELKCNGVPDCFGGSDEEGCDCREGEFQCTDGTCIPADRRCDAVADCLDGNDEADCSDIPNGNICYGDEYRCEDGTCIPGVRKCDGHNDCLNGDDEDGCPSRCLPDQFRCDNGMCVDLNRKCDRRRDCPDNSDEVDCPVVRTTTTTTTTTQRPTCGEDEWTCADGECIAASQRCDRNPDCLDYSDEEDCPTVPTVTVTPSDLTLNEGEAGSLQCEVTGATTTTGRWQRVDPRTNALQRLPTGVTAVGNELRINSARPEHAGTYVCTASGQEARATISVERAAPVTVTVTPSQLTVREGDEAVFECRASGRSGVQVKWFKGTSPIPEDATETNGRLYIESAKMEHRGTYICKAVGFPSGSEPQERAYLTVNAVPSTTTTRRPPIIGPGRCSADESSCTNGQCIQRDYVCDGDYDCTDRSDELNCVFPSQCEPNEFQCENKKCALKIWRCDGDNDCGDNSDEISCPTAGPGEQCQPTEFRCSSGNGDQCIPLSFLCDGEFDCLDRSDEIGCTKPTIVRPPPASKTVEEGNTITLECEAIGLPMPMILWRLNWGNIASPPRVTTTSVNGKGILTIRQATREDQGAYTCEALNSKGSVLAQPDTIVTVNPPAGICRTPQFNSDARVPSECMKCFCSGITDQCVSSQLYKTDIVIRDTLSLVERDDLRPLDGVVQYSTSTRDFKVTDYSRRVRGNYYWSLPSQFTGNRLYSYGGNLTYTISYTAQSRAAYASGADVILIGGGVSLYHRQLTQAFAGSSKTVSVPITEKSFTIGERGQVAKREDLMKVLQNVEYVLVKSNYDTNQRDVTIGNIKMTSATPSVTAQGRAFLIEECRCPTGYSGSSCESCATGYRRDGSGRCTGCACNGHADRCDPTSGVCVDCQHNTEGDRCDKCRAGYYGDATKGRSTDCQACPCPGTSGSNQFSKDCYLAPDNQVTCRGCPRGYSGRRCERCEAGYTGDPQAGVACQAGSLIGSCDARGITEGSPTDSTTGQCDCKALTTGPRCDKCAENSFYLSELNPDGCVACFCMGITRSCTSSTLNKAQISTTFTTSDIQDFALSDSLHSEPIQAGLVVDQRARQLTFRNFASLPPNDENTYYWSLPEKYLGNQVASYGGQLKFTVGYMSGDDRTVVDKPNVILHGNDVYLEYINMDPVRPETSSTMQVFFYEQHWMRADGQPATREHLLMALAQLDYLLIRATFSASTSQATLKDVAMDTATTVNTRLGRAFAVEQCSCPAGYQGLSCETCDTGYRRSGGGLYLGTCEACECNGHTNDCDPETGACKNCQHNTEGENCEQCAPGYYGDATNGLFDDCKPCPCPLTAASNRFSPTCRLDSDGQVTCTACLMGYTGRKCERCAPGYSGNPLVPGGSCTSTGRVPSEDDCECDSRGVEAGARCDPASGRCMCKANVEGMQCDKCKEGTFGLDASNAAGCTECYCSGLTSMCTTANVYMSTITPELRTDESHKFLLVTRRLGDPITEGIVVDAAVNEVSYNGFAQVQEGRQSLFWSLPPAFTGDKVASYGGMLRFSILYYARQDVEGEGYFDVDCELFGAETRLYHTFAEPPTAGQMATFEIPLVESSFLQPDGSQPSHKTFMSLLSNIENIIIRSTYDTAMDSSALRDLSLDSSTTRRNGQSQVTTVEICTCPVGYAGLSCQLCAPNYSRVGDRCISCNCNGHSTTCDAAQGICQDCQHNTAGNRCERCAPGFYGDATSGKPDACQPCACPLTVKSNQFSTTCVLAQDGIPTCDKCSIGYTGRDCGQCAPGFIGNPRVVGGKCAPSQLVSGKKPHVTAAPPRNILVVSQTATFTCSAAGDGRLTVRWTRADGLPLPARRATVGRDNSLTIRNLVMSDAGRYVCTATSEHGSGMQDAELVVIGERALTVIVRDPKEIKTTIGSTVKFNCIAISQYAYTLAWTKDDGSPLSPRFIDDGKGGLLIRNVKYEDLGRYRCTGSNFYTTAEDFADLTVEGLGEGLPLVRVIPSAVEVWEGVAVQFRCSVTSDPPAQIHWEGGPGGRLPYDAVVTNDVLRIPAVNRDEHEGDYKCVASNAYGTAESVGILTVLGA